MRHSDDRILVIHVGSLPRPGELLELLLAREQAPAEGSRRASERLWA